MVVGSAGGTVVSVLNPNHRTVRGGRGWRRGGRGQGRWGGGGGVVAFPVSF